MLKKKIWRKKSIKNNKRKTTAPYTLPKNHFGVKHHQNYLWIEVELKAETSVSEILDPTLVGVGTTKTIFG